jgi:NAD(P)H-hydrate epimerase
MSLPVLTIAQMREWEQSTWARGQTESSVIARVGAEVARRALALTRQGDRILLLAGKGHNGDDVMAARDHLANRVVDLLEIQALPEDFTLLETMLERQPHLIVDGLFGIGLDRPLSPEWIRLIERVNEARRPVLAVDVPSGLNADTGENFGAAIIATVTLAVGAPKTGLLRPAAWNSVGRLEVTGDVGLAPQAPASDTRWLTPEDFTHFPPARGQALHKGSFGHPAMLAGSLGYHGAGVLCASGAQRARPGLITLLTHPESYLAIASQLQSVMVGLWSDAGTLPTGCSALLVGPGLAAPNLPESMKMMTRRYWRDVMFPMVVDASGLDWLAFEPFPRGAIRVLSPHPGEAARLLISTPQKVQADRPGALRQLSRQFGNCWVVLKGHQTLIGRSDGEIYVNSSGNPYLAQGGSGDVLAGFLTGLLAQPELQADAGRTISYAVWQHGAAADALQSKRANWTIEELARELGTF